jgi:hypothetical protein
MDTWRNPLDGKGVVGPPPQAFEVGSFIASYTAIGPVNGFDPAEWTFGPLTQDQVDLLHWLERRNYAWSQAGLG